MHKMREPPRGWTPPSEDWTGRRVPSQHLMKAQAAPKKYTGAAGHALFAVFAIGHCLRPHVLLVVNLHLVHHGLAGDVSGDALSGPERC